MRRRNDFAASRHRGKRETADRETRRWVGNGETTREHNGRRANARRRKNQTEATISQFLINIHSSFPMNQGGSSLALQAVSRVKSANERPLRPRWRESFALLALRSPHRGRAPRGGNVRGRGRDGVRRSTLSLSSPPYPSNSARQPRGALSCANLFN